MCILCVCYSPNFCSYRKMRAYFDFVIFCECLFKISVNLFAKYKNTCHILQCVLSLNYEKDRLFWTTKHRQYAQIAWDQARFAQVLRRIFYRYRKSNDAADEAGICVRSQDIFLLSFHRNPRISKLWRVEFRSQTTWRSHDFADRIISRIPQLLRVRRRDLFEHRQDKGAKIVDDQIVFQIFLQVHL